MDQRTEAGLPASLVNGRLEGFSVPDLLWNLCRRRSTGVLHLTARGITKKVYINEGRIVFALSGDPDDRLGDLLLRDGLITLDQFEVALSQLSSGRRLGAILVAAGNLSPENLVRGVLNQVRGIVLALFPWDEGEYAFVAGPLPTEEVITLRMRTAEILLQGIRQIRSFSRIRKSVGPPSTWFRLATGWREVLDGLDIREGERMLLKRIDEAGSRGASVDAMCREVFLSNFEIYQALWAFLVLGIVEAGSGAEDTVPGAAIEGRLERTSLPEILVRLCRDGLTGVLHMAQGARERTLHIKEGTCVFATSNDVDDGLVAHLIRRGVISLSDREETARRLLSNKRVGTILLEMGVIDEGDLQATVREQLSEIIFDTFRWGEGEFRFREGPLPTVEEITLNRTVEDLVFAGVRRVTSWARVKQGCGGLGARLVLQPNYLSVLDKMSVGPEEWELISLLKTPRTVLEICRESMIGDFRSCQILWALRLLDAVGEAALEVSVDTALGALEASPVGTEAPTFAPLPVIELPAEAERALEVESEPARQPDPDRTPIPLSDADESAEVITEPWRLAAEKRPESPVQSVARLRPEVEVQPESRLEPGIELQPEVEVQPESRLEPGIELQPEVEVQPEARLEPGIELQLQSEVEAVSELETVEVAASQPVDDTVAISLEDVESAVRSHDAPGPRFALGEPGTGINDMRVDDTKIDLRPDALRKLELDESAEVAEDELDAIPLDRDEAVPESASIDAGGDLDRTARVSPDELEAALQEPTPPSETIAPTPPALEPPAFEPPDDLDETVASFNARHVILFRSLRAEIGAGAANFVRSCRGTLDENFAAMFESADLRADGSWDPDGLKRAVIEHRVANPSDGFRRLLDDELQRLRAHLGEARAAALADQLSTIP
jgi:hypothetical protein